MLTLKTPSLLGAFILKVSSLLISSSSKGSFQPLYFIWSSEPRAHQLTSKYNQWEGRGVCLSHPCLQQPLRDSWDRAQGPLALTLHRETLSFDPVLQTYPFISLGSFFKSNSLEMGRRFKVMYLSLYLHAPMRMTAGVWAVELLACTDDKGRCIAPRCGRGRCWH